MKRDLILSCRSILLSSYAHPILMLKNVPAFYFHPPAPNLSEDNSIVILVCVRLIVSTDYPLLSVQNRLHFKLKTQSYVSRGESKFFFPIFVCIVLIKYLSLPSDSYIECLASLS